MAGRDDPQTPREDMAPQREPGPASPSPSAAGGASGRTATRTRRPLLPARYWFRRRPLPTRRPPRPGPGCGAPRGGPVARHPRDGHGRGVQGRPAEGEARLAQADLGPFGGAERAVADRREQVGEGLTVDEDGHRDQRDYQDLERPGQGLVGGAHEERVAVRAARIAIATCFISTPTIISNQRMATIRPKPRGASR